MSTIDHLVLAESRLATEYRESLNLINYIRSLLLEANTLEQVFQDLVNTRTIDTATGTTLDIIGAIVGQPRSFVVLALFSFFGYRDLDGDFPVNTGGYSSLDDPSAGSEYLSLEDDLTDVVQLDDESYRLFIRARIARNFTKATPEEVIQYAKFVIDAPIVALEEGEDAEYSLYIGRVLTDNERAIIVSTDFIPKPIGVNVNYLDFELGNVFAFAGFPDAKGFGEAPFVNIFG